MAGRVSRVGGRRAPIFAGIGVAAAVLIVLFFLVLPKMGQVKDANATLTELQAQQATLGCPAGRAAAGADRGAAEPGDDP